MEWTKEAKLKVSSLDEERICVFANTSTVLTVMPHALLHFDATSGLTLKDTCLTETLLEENVLLITFDILREYQSIMEATLEAKGSTLYRVLTGLPIPYTLAPQRVRDMFMKNDAESENLTLADKLPMDALRFILVKAIEKLSGKRLSKRTWNGKRFACILTHDIETREGLRSAKRLKKLEEKYDVPSAWYVPAEHYELDNEILKELADFGEIGAHDTKHDGKLIRLPRERLVKRLKEAKDVLDRAVSSSIDGFRAPLLQHNFIISEALNQAGYHYDASIPTWEPKHPYTMKPHGIGTVFPFSLNGVVEIPVTLPQDHQMFHSLHMNPQKTVEAWARLMKEIESTGGLCAFLVHPDYELAEQTNQRVYEDLLSLISNCNAAVILPRNAMTNATDVSVSTNQLAASLERA